MRAPSLRSRLAPTAAPPIAKSGLGPRNPWPGEDSGWLITLSDLTLLLLCFLVLWYVNENKRSAAAQQTSAPAEAVAVEASVPSESPAESDTDSLEALRSDIRQFINASGLENDIEIEGESNEILLSLKDTIPFESGKADLRRAAFPVLEKVAAMAHKEPRVNLEISGHTDDRPIATKAFPSNWELSSARAGRVGRYLIQRGVQPSRIAVQGFANHRPRLPNSSPGNRSRNRRVEIRLYFDPHNSAAAGRPSAGDEP